MRPNLLLLLKWPCVEILFPFLLLMTFNSCHDHVDSSYTYRFQMPVFMQMSTLREDEIIIEPDKSLDNPGKIYLYGDYLLINEPKKGIHIVDNTNPSKPQLLNFINIPGNVDLAVNSNILYADSYVDLLAFDISNPAAIKTITRVKDVFTHMYTDPSTTTFITYKDTVITADPNSARGWGNSAW